MSVTSARLSLSYRAEDKRSLKNCLFLLLYERIFYTAYDHFLLYIVYLVFSLFSLNEAMACDLLKYSH